MLEERLVDYEGTLLLVSHDRAFLDNVVTTVFVFDGAGAIEEFVGGYSDWAAYHQQQRKIAQASKKNKGTQKTSKATAQTPKITYKQQQELTDLPEKIEQLEGLQDTLNGKINAPDFYQQSKEITTKILYDLQETEQKLEQTYQHWDKLEALSK
jgi:ATP-binding cassette subfamily F protein uup